MKQFIKKWWWFAVLAVSTAVWTYLAVTTEDPLYCSLMGWNWGLISALGLVRLVL